MDNELTFNEYQRAINDAERKRKADFTKAKNEVAAMKARYMAAKATYMTRLTEIDAEYSQTKKDAWARVDEVKFMQSGAATEW